MRNARFQTASLYSAQGARKYVAPDERERFLAAARACTRPELGTLCLTLAHTGCRLSEALALTVGAIERQDGFIAIRSLKRRDRAVVIREVPVPADLLDALERVHRLSTCAPDRKLWRLCRSRAWQLVKLIMSAAEVRAGIHATPKGLRHGFGLHAVRCGVPLNLVQRWLGHASMATTAIYLQAMGREEREIAARMWV